MPFESLTDRLRMTFRRITGRAVLNEKDIDDMMREVRLSLLEADVNYKVVKKFTADVKAKALGEKIMKSLTPGDMVVKAVHDELKALMGEEAVGLNLKKGKTNVIMLVGLQGTGKTTTCGKLADMLRKKENRKPLLIAGDIKRPAAIEQLQTIGKQIETEVFTLGCDLPVTEIVRKGIAYAHANGFDPVIIDTAGRLHISEEPMRELSDIARITAADEILLTVDAMMGQDAVNVITAFNEQLPLTGCILTKLDGDTRGGAALSVRYLTNIPIKYTGVGEKIDQLEVFHPDRMAGRILGMGDIVSLAEKASEAIDEREAEKMAEKIQKGIFDYNDFMKQLKWIKRMGSLKGILGLLPGIGPRIRDLDIDNKQFIRIETIIMAMTPEERKHPELTERSFSRRERISKGSGRPYQEVNGLIKRFNEMKKQIKNISSMSEGGLPRNITPSQNQRKGKGKGRGNFRI